MMAGGFHRGECGAAGPRNSPASASAISWVHLEVGLVDDQRTHVRIAISCSLADDWRWLPIRPQQSGQDHQTG